MIFVYLVLCEPTGQLYVGVTSKTPEARWIEHCREARRRRRRTPLYDAIRQHGPDAFKVEAHRELTDWNQAFALERELIRVKCTKHPAGLNDAEGGPGCPGRVTKETTREKIARESTLRAARIKRQRELAAKEARRRPKRAPAPNP